MKTADRLVLFCVFSVAASLVPLATDAIAKASDKNQTLTLARVIGHGQLLLVAVAILFPAVGAILMSNASKLTRGFVGGLAVVGLVLIAILYARFASASASRHFAVTTSIALFAAAAIVGALCVALAKTE